MKKSKLGGEHEWWTAHENQCCVEVLVVLLDVVRVVLGRLSLVYRVEIEARIVVLDGLEECSECILETMSV